MSGNNNGERPVPLTVAEANHIRRDLWFGNGKPGLTTRMQQSEDRLSNLEKNLEEYEDEMRAYIESNNKKVDRLTWLVAVGLGILMALQFVLRH